MSGPTDDDEEAAVRLALEDPSAYLLEYADRSGYLDREARILAARRVRDELEAHEMNRLWIVPPAHKEV